MNYTERWLTKEEVFFEDDVPIIAYKIVATDDDEIRNEWAEHIRKHYISDADLDEECAELSLTKSEYLRNQVIPQRGETFAATAISADITEILVSDILQFVDGYNVPRIKQLNRSGKNQVEHGSDIVAYKYASTNATQEDVLLVVEVKASLSSENYSKIAEAVHHSAKDEHRHGHTLNYYRKKLKKEGLFEEASRITRFAKKVEGVPYKTEYLPAVVKIINTITTNDNKKIIPLNSQRLSYTSGRKTHEVKLKRNGKLYLIYGTDLMNLAYDIYRRICEC